MLLPCPECGHQVSDRAAACPSCGFPVAEHLAEHAAAPLDHGASRRSIGEVDCTHCDARGFRSFQFTTLEGEVRDGFEWCAVCEHTGRVALCQSTTGYYAVEAKHLAAFLSGADDLGDASVVALGPEKPKGHRYPTSGSRNE